MIISHLDELAALIIIEQDTLSSSSDGVRWLLRHFVILSSPHFQVDLVP